MPKMYNILYHLNEIRVEISDRKREVGTFRLKTIHATRVNIEVILLR